MIRSLVLVVALVSAASTAGAQAWMPGPGEVRLRLSYEYFSGGDNLFNNDSLDGFTTNGYKIQGRRGFLGDVFSHTGSLAVEAGVAERLSVYSRVAAITAIYEGLAPANLAIDDGLYHSTLQDLQFGIRTPLLRRRVHVSAGLGMSVPLTDYEVTGQTAPGLGTTEVQGALYLGIRDWGWRRSFYAQTSLVRRWVRGGGNDLPQFADVGLEFGFFPASGWAISASSQQQFAWDGLDWLSNSGPSVHGDPSRAQVQTKRSNVRYNRLAIGVDRFWGEYLTTSLFYTNTLWAENTTDSTAIVLSVGWGFRAPWAPQGFWY